jgi:3',5'-cyclic AMP phosphodiesterase CpdA
VDTTPRGGGPAVLVGAGDIAECGLPGAEATARLLDEIPGTVFTAGDNAYYQGSLRDYEQCYAPTWGRHRDRTRPVPGNHEYETPGAAGYFTYFGAAASPASEGVYSYNVGAWHIAALNSNIAIDSASAQLAWLRNDLAAHPARCTAAILHHPLFSSGANGGDARVRAVWDLLYREGADLVVSGHDHLYERFAPQDPDGHVELARGVRQFVVGTGGAHLTPNVSVRANSEARATVWGIAKFTLSDGGYQWEFIPVAGETFRDTGSDTCH